MVLIRLGDFDKVFFVLAFGAFFAVNPGFQRACSNECFTGLEKSISGDKLEFETSRPLSARTGPLHLDARKSSFVHLNKRIFPSWRAVVDPESSTAVGRRNLTQRHRGEEKRGEANGQESSTFCCHDFVSLCASVPLCENPLPRTSHLFFLRKRKCVRQRNGPATMNVCNRVLRDQEAIDAYF